jgi:hypothetical protein
MMISPYYFGPPVLIDPVFKPVVGPQVKVLQKNFQCPMFNRVGTMRDMESWAVCYCHFKKCQCKCTFTFIIIDIFKKKLST